MIAAMATVVVAAGIVVVPRFVGAPGAVTATTDDLDLVAYSTLPGFMARVAKSTNSSEATRSVTAFCKDKQVVVGGYGEIEDGDPVNDGDISAIALPSHDINVKVANMGPTSTTKGYGFTIGAVEIGDYSGDWYLRAVVFCADMLPGYQLLTNSVPRSSVALKRVSYSCTLDNTFPIVAGGGINARHASDLAKVTLRGFSIDVITADASADAAGGVDWGMYVSLVCANPIPGYAVKPASSHGRIFAIAATAQCPHNTRGFSAVGDIDPGMPTHLTGISYLPRHPDQPIATAYHNPGNNDDAAIHATAVCAI
jgi:hypothetical protein